MYMQYWQKLQSRYTMSHGNGQGNMGHGLIVQVTWTHGQINIVTFKVTMVTWEAPNNTDTLYFDHITDKVYLCLFVLACYRSPWVYHVHEMRFQIHCTITSLGAMPFWIDCVWAICVIIITEKISRNCSFTFLNEHDEKLWLQSHRFLTMLTNHSSRHAQIGHLIKTSS